MLAREAQRIEQAQGPEGAVDPNLRGLLDHIAAELAEEYIRLMEAAVEAEAAGQRADEEAIEGDER